MAKNEVDETAIERLRQDIARDRLRLAQRLAMDPEGPGATPDASTRVGRLHRVFTLMGEC